MDFNFSELEILKIETEDRYFVTEDGELVNEPLIHVTARPKVQMRYIEMQITVLPSGSIIE